MDKRTDKKSEIEKANKNSKVNKTVNSKNIPNSEFSNVEFAGDFDMDDDDKNSTTRKNSRRCD
ncbi:MAG: hypothetical protein IJ583_04895 [Firmicutes bacterium]|nr:hypothetical protein [Bacillota bacterium]